MIREIQREERKYDLMILSLYARTRSRRLLVKRLPATARGVGKTPQVTPFLSGNGLSSL